MSYTPELSKIVCNVQFLCGYRIPTSRLEEIGHDAEIMLCSAPENFSKLSDLLRNLSNETDDFILNLYIDIDPITITLFLFEYDAFIKYPDLYEIVFGDFDHDALQLSEFEYFIRRNKANIAITIGQIANNIIHYSNDDELIFISEYELYS